MNDKDKFIIIDESNDRRYFSMLPHYILNHSTAIDQALYMQIKRFSGENGTCWASKKTLIKKLGIGKQALEKSLRYLITKKWIYEKGMKKIETEGGPQEIMTYGIHDIWKQNINFYDEKGSSRIAPLYQKDVLEEPTLFTKVVLEGGSRIAPNKNHSKEEPIRNAETSSAESRSWILEEKLQEMEKKENSHLDIISTFIREKPVEVENSKQLSAIIGRFCKTAQKISGAYRNEKVFDAIKRIKEDNESRLRRNQDSVDWTLETVLKYLTK